MDENIFQLTKDFYTLKAEYEMNMQQLAKTNQRMQADIEALRKSFNELRDSMEKHEKDLHS